MMPVRFSYLKAMAKSPAHARHAMTEDSVSTDSQQRGTAVHALVLGNQRVTVAPEGIKKPTSAQRNAKKPKGGEGKKAEAAASAQPAAPKAKKAPAGAADKTKS